jgi:hypothetical protein
MKPMTEVTVLRTVPVSDDGITLREIVKGTTDQVLSELFDGLKAEGYVVAVDDAPASIETAGNKPDLPADWRELHFMKQIHLAKQFDPAVTKKDEAVAALEAAEKAAPGAAQG